MLTHNIQDRGTLSFTNFDDLPFQPKRFMTMYNIPKGEVRGKHAHREDRQILICLSGKIRVKLIGKDWDESHILNPGDSILQDTYVWAEQEYLEDDTIMVVLCSEKFNKNEYIWDIEEIINGIK